MKTSLRLAALTLLSVLTLSANAVADEDEANHVCQNKKWTGSYLQALNFYGPGSFVRQWNFNRDGTLISTSTAAPEDAPTSGTGTPIVGSWECREDGTILATYSYALYNPGWMILGHIRATAVVTITDDNTLRRTAFVSRFYEKGEDVTDPNGGHKTVRLAPLGWELTRLRAADEDLQDLP